MTVKWGKVGGAAGYQIQYSAKKDFSKAKSLKISDPATLSRVVKNLTKNFTYYVRIRGFKTVDNATYYSVWSNISSVAIKTGVIKRIDQIPTIIEADVMTQYRVYVRWNAVNGVTGYQLSYRPQGGKWKNGEKTQTASDIITAGKTKADF